MSAYGNSQLQESTQSLQLKATTTITTMAETHCVTEILCYQSAVESHYLRLTGGQTAPHVLSVLTRKNSFENL